MKKLSGLVSFLTVLVTILGAAVPAAGQSLGNHLLALYPKEAGELVFVNLRALRDSRHYLQLKAQLLPERFRQLELFTQALGIDFDRQVQQLSWAFLSGEPVGFVGTAEGSFLLNEVERTAQLNKLPLSRFRDYRVVSLGRNEQGQEFVFAFVDQATALFGFREPVEAMLTRKAGGQEEGGASLLENEALRALIEQVNARAPLWLVLNNQFSALALRQMLPEATRIPGFETVIERVQSATLRFELGTDLRGLGSIRCQGTMEALWFSTLIQAALYYQTWRLGDTNPELARVLGDLRIDRRDAQLDLDLTIPETTLVALLQKGSFTLKF